MRLAIFLRTIFALLLFLSVECETMHTAYGKVVEKQTARSQGNVAAAAEPAKPAAPKLIRHSVKISAVGDCTIGWDDRFPRGNRFDTYLENNGGDYGYYLAKVREVFREDDLTIANLESALTTHPVKMEKTFNFSAPESYKNVLTQGCVEAVSLGNNHTYDFGETGYQDTLAALDSAGILHFGHGAYGVQEIRGVKIGFFSLLDYGCQYYHEIDNALAYLKSRNCDLIIASMHWGTEYEYAQNYAQINMAHYLVDQGVDLVLGSHPHVLQGIEKYKGKYILYSMGNFCFGGNTDPEADLYLCEPRTAAGRQHFHHPGFRFRRKLLQQLPAGGAGRRGKGTGAAEDFTEQQRI